jgi:tetratricopeptide (TPR) repeat protein
VGAVRTSSRRAALHAASAAAAVLAMTAAPAVAEAPVKPEAKGPLDVRVGEAKDLAHIEFRWTGGARMNASREGQVLTLSFSRWAQPDMSRLSVDPPKFLKGASARKGKGGGLELQLTLADDADAKTGEADGADFVNLFAKPPQAPQPIETPVSAPRPNPVPDSGIVAVQAARTGPQVVMAFPWKAPLGAAAFRRGDAIWLVFDASAKLDVEAAQRLMPQLPIRVIQGGDYTALRIPAPVDLPYSVSAQAGTWRLILGPGEQARTMSVPMSRDRDDGPATLAANVAGATRVIWLDDPAVGDQIAVVTALGPAKGLLLKRTYVDLNALPSAQGLAITPKTDGLQLSTDGDVVRITKVGGLTLSPRIHTQVATTLELPQAAPMPGLVPFDQWSDTGGQDFVAREDALMNAAAAEANREALGDKSAGMAARMGFARFLVGSELSFESIGVLNTLAKAHASLESDAEFRALRGVAKILAGRYSEAQADLASAALTEDPASALWRGYAAAKLGQWTDARQAFLSGDRAMKLFTPAWRGRFARADAEASLKLNDFAGAMGQIKVAIDNDQDPNDKLATFLVLAKLVEAMGLPDKALPIYDAVARAPNDRLATQALLHATQIRLYAGKISPDKAAGVLNTLRFRWRGDGVELQVIKALGDLYLAQGRYREALETLRTGRVRGGARPEAIAISDDLSNAFKELFLQGGADGMQPIQALGLFYDFKDLTPVGADGDEMVRKLAQRLVNVDLLDQAGELLKYQADNRLDGVPRATVDTDLAIIELMARHPEKALDALNSSRSTLLPGFLQQQRRMVETRAWLQLGQLDHAAEILGNDNSPEGVDLRAEIAWRKRDWPTAGKVFEQSLGDRWRVTDQPLTPEEESKLLRAAVAYSLTSDNASLKRLSDRYGGFVNRARWPDALRVALSGVNVDQITSANFAAAVNEDAAFAGWVDKMKDRFRQKPLGSPDPAPTLRPLTTASADAGVAGGASVGAGAAAAGGAKGAKTGKG